jgi:hypothetical protein
MTDIFECRGETHQGRATPRAVQKRNGVRPLTNEMDRKSAELESIGWGQSQ